MVRIDRRSRRRRFASCLFLMLAVAGKLFVAESKGLCIPMEERRAYVTAVTEYDNITGSRVLIQSLRDSNCKADIIVLLSSEAASQANLRSLQQDGVKIRILETFSGRSDISKSRSFSLASMLTSLWNLVEYDRLVYLGPNTLVTKNPDALFACEGFCSFSYDSYEFLGAVDNQRLVTDVMVLEPRLESYNSARQRLLDFMAKSSHYYGSEDIMSSVLPPVSQCPIFENLEDFLNDGQETTDADGPILMLNAAHMPICASGTVLSDPGKCHQLPFTYAASSDEFHRLGSWKRVEDKLGRDGKLVEPHIVRFNVNDLPWGGINFLRKPLFWRWNSFRRRLAKPYGSVIFPLVLTLLPYILMLFAYYHRFTKSTRNSQMIRNDVMDVCISKQLPMRCIPSTMNTSSICIPRAVLCVIILSLAIMWYILSIFWSQGFADAAWHPIAFTLVQNAWLSCALAAGLYTIDYVYFLLETNGKTLVQDLFTTISYIVIMLLVWRIVVPMAVPFSTWKILITLTTLAFGVIQMKRNTSFQTSSHRHLGIIIGSCLSVGIASAVLAFLSSIDSSYSKYFSVLSAVRMISTLAVYTNPFVGSVLEGMWQRLYGALLISSFSSGPSIKKGDRSVLSIIRSSLLHVIFEHWDWVITGFALVWVAVPLAWELRRRATDSSENTIAKRYQIYGEQCLASDRGYANRRSSMSASCGASETFKPIIMTTGAICLRAIDGRFLTPLRGKLTDECIPEAQFEFQVSTLADSQVESKTKSIGEQFSERPRLCLYNPATKFFLSSTNHPQPLCRRTEQWQIISWSW